eukprot:TRINITY_DN12164_c0_g1_i1.p1 TRINITY_DN12164_c0_g1~~TRINITY_DN12164_c0_g1_i1.p1  ORF type:complete len:111 (+),score=23.35 TRINITY_DN12164_c0_g1_i1:384-716(+)
MLSRANCIPYACLYACCDVTDSMHALQRFMLPHRFLGLAAYLSACITICMGLSYYNANGDYNYDRRVVQTASLVVCMQAMHIVAGVIAHTNGTTEGEYELFDDQADGHLD